MNKTNANLFAALRAAFPADLDAVDAMSKKWLGKGIGDLPV